MTDEPTDSGGGEPPEQSQSSPRRPAKRTNGATHAEVRPRPRTPRSAAAGDAPSRARKQVVTAAAPKVLDEVEAEHIELHQGRIGSATARSVVVRQSAVGGAQADEVLVTQGAIGGARARQITIDKGAVGGALAGDFRLRYGFAQGVVARDVTIEQGGARTVIGNTVTMGRQSGALVVIARRVEGGRFLLDWRGALALGAAFAVVSALVRQRRPRTG